MPKISMRNNWDDVKDRIYSLYKLQRRPLPDVMRYMSTNYGFNASLRTYKEKVKEWGYTKNRPRRRPGQRSNLGEQQPLSEASDETLVPSFSSLDPASRISNDVSSFGPYQNNLAQTPLNYDSPALWTFGTPQNHYLGPMEVGYNARSPLAISPFNSPAPLPSVRDNILNMQDSSGRTPLHRAIIIGSVREVERCLSSRAAVNISDSDGNQPLHLAAAGAFPEIVRLLLEQGADIEAKDQGGKTSLHMCLRSPETLKMLLKWHPIVSGQDRNGDTPLHLAVALSAVSNSPRGSVTEKLIKSGANVNAPNLERITPFHMALERLRLAGKCSNSWISLFLENGAEVLSPAKDERLPFQIYLENIDFQLIGLLDRDEASSLAANCFKMFLDRGADVNTVLKSGETLINEVLNSVQARPARNVKLARYLWKNADLARAGASGDYPLHCLVRKWLSPFDLMDLLQVILDRKVDPDQKNRAGQTPLIAALSRSDNNHYLSSRMVEIIEVLLKGGAGPMQRDISGNLPIYITMRYRQSRVRQDIVMLLLKAMALSEVSAQSSFSDTDQRWWDVYRLLYQRTIWSGLEDLLASSHLLPVDVADDLNKEALLLLTQKFILSLKADIESAQATGTLDRFTRKSKREELVRILRDCRSLKVDVDPSWYDLLLDLQE